ncbi:MAG: hypothetical protein M1829_004686 [Trizodia sp. TS-e1964]|nr:MAG: hypothetical protein M1829_004686 [Trizodia sp. TS-e1964]
MFSVGRLLRIPRPKKFLYLMALLTGTELIILTLLLNKLSGLYGLLAIFTGTIRLSPLQLSMYIYSCAALLLAASLAPYIRKHSLMPCLALAWFYVIDSVVNGIYTAAFAMTWFLTISSSHTEPAEILATQPGRRTIGDSAGFTNPKFNVSRVKTTFDNTTLSGAAALAVGIGNKSTTAATESTGPSLGNGVPLAESMPALLIILALWIVRVYFILIVMSFARQTLQQHILSTTPAPFAQNSDSSNSKSLLDDPFSLDRPEGRGLRGTLGRLMVATGRRYWLGISEDENWEERAGAGIARLPKRFDSLRVSLMERDKRKRSGTGPSSVSVPLMPLGNIDF